MPEVDWDRRRRNLRIIMAAQGTNPTKLADQIGLSANTLSKFVNGSTEKLSQPSLEKVIPALGLTSAEDLDSDNPLDDPKAALRRIIDALHDEDLRRLARELKARFGNLSLFS